MDTNQQEQLLEEEYLNKTLTFLHNQLETENAEVIEKEDDIIAYRREMYENAGHDSQDFNKLSETVQYLNPLIMRTMDYRAAQQRVALYERMKINPYFARVDFETDQWGKETVYIGIGNLENEDTFESFVYDWRAPISSIFYRFELGKASYEAPVGLIEGEITLKRQFEIKDGHLDFFFDSSVNIVDDILKEALRKNTSPKMRTIVETIQREQDLIIRDVDNDLLIVQGVAGSGKTSIALHRAAYLMYQGLQGRLSANNMILISPNTLFARYIADVLPDLGEENIKTVTFENLFYKIMDENIDFQKRNEVLEEILTATPNHRILLQNNLLFKSSDSFLTILHRLIQYYEKHMIPFADVMYSGETIFKKEILKERFLSSSTQKLPVQIRLEHIESLISEKITSLRPHRMKVLEDYMVGQPGRDLDFKSAARLLNMKQVSRIIFHVRKFTRIDFKGLYSKLFQDEKLFCKLAEGLPLPENIEDILAYTKSKLDQDTLDYSDAMALFLLQLQMSPTQANIDIRQVVVDEAQDYSPVHFEILKRLYPSAKYTILGDVNQTIVETGRGNIYHSIEEILDKKTSTTVTLNKSFRCSYEISKFAAQFSETANDMEQLDRFEKVPDLICQSTDDKLIESLLIQLAQWKSEGYKTIAVISKSGKDSEELYKKLSSRWDARLVTDESSSPIVGTMLLPIYLAKGLEFDAVAVYDVDKERFYTRDDRRLLYIASTRALHRLSLFHSNTLSPLITSPKEIFDK